MLLVTIIIFDFATEAQLTRAKLESEGIKAVIQDENTIAINPLYNYALGGIKLQVLEKDVDEAVKILNTVEETPWTDENDNPVNCPHCQSPNVLQGFNSFKSFKTILMLLLTFATAGLAYPFYLKKCINAKTIVKNSRLTFKMPWI